VAGLESIHFVNVLSRPIVAPWGGRDARIGTNPFCVGIPRQGANQGIVDFATTRSAQGKVRVAYNKDEKLPAGTMLDDRGEPTTRSDLGCDDRKPSGTTGERHFPIGHSKVRRTRGCGRRRAIHIQA